jgi:hypothetical protein
MTHKLPLHLKPWFPPDGFRPEPVSLRDALKAEQDSRDAVTKAGDRDLKS